MFFWGGGGGSEGDRGIAPFPKALMRSPEASAPAEQQSACPTVPAMAGATAIANGCILKNSEVPEAKEPCRTQRTRGAVCLVRCQYSPPSFGFEFLHLSKKKAINYHAAFRPKESKRAT